MPETHFFDAQLINKKREIDKADQSSGETSCIISDIVGKMRLPIDKILPTVQERFTPDGLLNSATWEDRQAFYTLRVLLEQDRISVSRTGRVPIPNKTFEEFYHELPDFIKE